MPLTLRQIEILSIARTEGRVGVDDLTGRLQVTPQTIRRDLADLDARGEVERVHGGAVLASGVTHIDYAARRGLNASAKEQIAALAARQIPNDSSLFLNIGTTTEAVASALTGHRNLLVVTNNMNVAQTIARNPGCEVIVTGGILRAEDGGLVGVQAAAAVARFKLDLAIIGASALDGDGEMLDFDHREVEVSQAMLAQARRRMLVADASKFQRAAPVRIGSVSTLEVFATDTAPPRGVQQLCGASGTDIVITRNGEGRG